MGCVGIPSDCSTVGESVARNESTQASGEVGSTLGNQGASDDVMGESIDMAREEVGVVGKRLPGVVGAEDSSSFRLEGTASSLDSVWAGGMSKTGAVGEADSELERERIVGKTGNSASGAGLG